MLNPFLFSVLIADSLLPVVGVIKRKIDEDGAMRFSDAILFIFHLIQRCFPVNNRGEQYTGDPLPKHKAPICHKTDQGASHG